MQRGCVALTTFVHDHIHAIEGKPLPPIPELLARDLEKRGLVWIKTEPVARPAPLNQTAGKLQAAGVGQPSSSSLAAQALPKPTSKPSAHGAKQRRGGTR